MMILYFSQNKLVKLTYIFLQVFNNEKLIFEKNLGKCILFNASSFVLEDLYKLCIHLNEFFNDFSKLNDIDKRIPSLLISDYSSNRLVFSFILIFDFIEK